MKEILDNEKLAQKEEQKILNKILNQKVFRVSKCLWELQSLIKYNLDLELYRYPLTERRVDRNSAYLYWEGPVFHVRYTGCNEFLDFSQLPIAKRDAVKKIIKRTWAIYFFRNQSIESTRQLIDDSKVDKETGEIIDSAVPKSQEASLFELGDLIF